MTEMPINDRYIAKESLTPLSVSVVMFVLGLYAAINTSEIWCVLGAVFFGLGVAVYAYKYIRYGRTTLIIDSEGITIKDWGKTKTYNWWWDIVSVYTSWNVSYFARFVERRLSIKTSVNGEQYEFHDICLSDLYCRSKSVRKAIEKYAGQSRFDYEASQKSKNYVTKIVLASIVAVIVIFICITCFSE